MQTMVPLYGFGGVPHSAIRRAAPQNLLDNSDFTNLVAQAGIGGNHGSVTYAADRWILTSGTVSYEAGVGLTLDGTITQNLERSPESATPAVGMVSGTAEIGFSNGAVQITSSGGVLKWAALYEGAYTAATMPEYHPKGYGAELDACQRYYVWYSSLALPINPYSATAGNGIIYLPACIRITPTISCNVQSIRSDGENVGNAGNVSVVSTNTNTIGIGLGSSSGLTPNKLAYLYLINIEISADL